MKLLRRMKNLLPGKILKKKDNKNGHLKYLIAGLGNFGEEYSGTRHNIGFMILDALADAFSIQFRDERFAFTSSFTFKGRIFFLIKPTTYMNRSGRAVQYWLNREKIPLDRLLVVVDDTALPFGKIRLRPHGGDGGHNGLKSIIQELQTDQFSRMRLGIGPVPEGVSASDFVLRKFLQEEIMEAKKMIKIAADATIFSITHCLEEAMNKYNINPA